MNTFGFFSFWTVMAAFLYLLFYGGDRPWAIFARVAGVVILGLIVLFFLLGVQPRIVG